MERRATRVKAGTYANVLLESGVITGDWTVGTKAAMRAGADR